MARPRLILVATLALLGAASLASSSPALGPSVSQAAQRHAVRRHAVRRHALRRSTRAHKAPSCARSASFRARHRRSIRQSTRCVKRPASRHARSFHASSHTHRHSTRRKTRHKATAPAAHRAPNAANSSSCPDADLTPTPEDIERVRAATFCLVNRERTANGERPLQENANLDQSAQSHTQSMAVNDYFEHDGPGGDTPASRMRSAGYIYSSRVGYEVGENIGWGTLWLATPRAIVAAWMASPGHRANILDTNFRDTGIGVSAHPPQSLAHGQAGAVYTQDFGVIITG